MDLLGKTKVSQFELGVSGRIGEQQILRLGGGYRVYECIMQRDRNRKKINRTVRECSRKKEGRKQGEDREREKRHNLWLSADTNTSNVKSHILSSLCEQSACGEGDQQLGQRAVLSQQPLQR